MLRRCVDSWLLGARHTLVYLIKICPLPSPFLRDDIDECSLIDMVLQLNFFSEFGVLPEIGRAVDDMGWT